jgi:polar amino acid transport system substrate-binding protein
MKNLFFRYLLVAAIFCVLSGCNSNNHPKNTLTFATSAEYPPFEYTDGKQIKGFDIELAELIAKELGKQAVFQNIQFSSILPALQTGIADAAIATITVTDERKKVFDFSDLYYTDGIALVYPVNHPITTEAALAGKKIACQMGTTMQFWLEHHMKTAHVILMDNNNQAIEALKSNYVDAVLMDNVQSAVFSKKNPGLAHSLLAQSDAGYAIAFKKGSPLKDEVNNILKKLEASGAMKILKRKWGLQ